MFLVRVLLNQIYEIDCMLTLEYIYDVRLTFHFDDFHYPVMFDEHSANIKILQIMLFQKKNEVYRRIN